MEKIYEKALVDLCAFVDKYGYDAFVTALQNYDSAQQAYTYRTGSLIKQIPICTINYIEILGHKITIHTTNGNFSKYGTLKEEYKNLKSHGFVKCNQSFLIPMAKVKEICGRTVILTTGDKFILSRTCANSIITAYSKQNLFPQ